MRSAQEAARPLRLARPRRLMRHERISTSATSIPRWELLPSFPAARNEHRSHLLVITMVVLVSPKVRVKRASFVKVCQLGGAGVPASAGSSPFGLAQSNVQSSGDGSGSMSSSATSTYGYSYQGSGGGTQDTTPATTWNFSSESGSGSYTAASQDKYTFSGGGSSENAGYPKFSADTMDQSSYQYSSYQAATRYKGANSGSGSFTTTIDDNTIVSHHASFLGESPFTTTFGGSGSASTTYSGSSDADPDFWWNEAYTNSWVPADGGSDIAVTFTSDESEGQDVNLITGGVNTGLVTSGPDPYSSATNLWGASVGFAQGLPGPAPVLSAAERAGRDLLDGRHVLADGPRKTTRTRRIRP